MSTNSCYNQWTFYVSSALSIICLITTFIIFIKSVIKFRAISQEQSELGKYIPIIKFLYYISCILALIIICIYTLGSYVCNTSINEHSDNEIIQAIVYTIPGCLYFILILCILGILLLRLYYTFKTSVLEITKYTKITFIILYILCVFTAICATFVSIRPNNLRLLKDFIYYPSSIDAPMISLSSLIFGLLYIITSIYGLVFFIHKMFKLTNLGAVSAMNVDDENMIECNQTQKEFLQVAAKYVSLLSLAIITTLLAFISYGFIVFAYYMHWMGTNHHSIDIIAREAIQIMTPLDCMINIICLYLQCPFANDDFTKYCSIYGKCWNKCFENKTKNRIKQRYRDRISTISKQKEVVIMTSIPNNSNTSTPVETADDVKNCQENKYQGNDDMDRDLSTAL